MHNSRTVCRRGSVTSQSFFSSNFTAGQGTFAEIFIMNDFIGLNALTIVGPFFLSI